jgi:uncharacterized protein DUF3309
MAKLLPVALLAITLTGCFGYSSGSHWGYYGGGGIGLFVLIFAAAVLFGRRRT